MLNQIVIQGRITKDIALQKTKNDKPVVSFSIACQRDYGEGEKQTDFVDCVAFNATAEFLARYFKKGSLAIVQGRLQIRDWQDKDGNKRRSAEVIVERAYFGESKKDSGGVQYSAVTDADDANLPF